MMRNLIVLILLLFFWGPNLFAAQVIKIKGSSALVNLEGDSAAPGDSFYTLSPEGKKIGLLQITKVKGDKAIGKIVKGKVDVGMPMQLKTAKTAATHGSTPSGVRRAYWGGILGLGRDSLSAQVNNASNVPIETTALNGIGFSAMALFDYRVFPQIWFRGLAGVEAFSAAGSSVCGTGNTSACNVSIDYLSLDLMGRYLFSEGIYRPWLGGGVALMFPAAKSATVLDSDSIGSTSVIQLAGGLDWFVSKDIYIPLSIEYGLLPKSDQVNANWIEFRAGLAIPF